MGKRESGLRRSGVRWVMAAALAAGLFMGHSAAWGASGRIVVWGDDWSTTDRYWTASSQAFSLDVFGWLTQNTAGKRLIFDDSFDHYLPYTQMLATLTTNGYSITRVPTSLWTRSLLSGYDAALVQNGGVDSQALTDFVACGGGVWVVGGGEQSDSLYNAFLSGFEMSLSGAVQLSADITSFVPHPLTVGVTALHVENPTPVNATGPDPVILSTQYGYNWLAALQSTLDCPPTATQPSTWGSVKTLYR